MAVVDIYSQANIEAGNGKKIPALNGTGTNTIKMVATASIDSGDDNGSIYRLFAGVPSNYVPINITVHNTAITAGTAYVLGLYSASNGAVIDADVLATTLDMSSARAITAANNVGMTAIAIANGTQSLATLSAQTDPAPSYDICLTANTVGTASGTIRVTAEFATI
jgi:hypothetical protein